MLKGSFCIPFEFFETIIPMIVNIFTKIEKVIEKTSNNQQLLQCAKEWFNNERNYITDTFLLKEKVRLIKTISHITIHESEKVTTLMTDLTNYLSKYGEGISKEYTNLVERRKDLSEIILSQQMIQRKNVARRKTTRKSLMLQDRQLRRTSEISGTEDDNGKVFGCISGENQTIGKIMDELEKQMNGIEKNLTTIIEKWKIISCKEKSKLVLRNKAKELWNKYKEEKKINWEELKELLLEEVDDNLAYDEDIEFTNTQTPEIKKEISKESSDKRIDLSSQIKLEELDTKVKTTVRRESKSSKQLVVRTSFASNSSPNSVEEIVMNKHHGSRSKRTNRVSRSSIVISGPITEVAVVQDFIGNDGQFVDDAFLDVNSYRLSQYKSMMKKLQKDVTQILVKLNDLKELQQKTRDPDSYSERSYMFAHGYLDTPRLHLKWFEKIAEEQSVRQHYVEAGLCEIHMICFIAQYLENGEEFDILKRITLEQDNTIKDKQKEMIEGFSEEELFIHINLAYKYFSIRKICDFAEILLLAVINYLNKRSDYKRLDEYHKKLTQIYTMKGKHEEGQKHFFNVTFYGTIFDKLNEKSMIYQTHLTKEAFSQEIKGIVPLDKKKEIKHLEENRPVSTLKPEEIYIKIDEVYPIYSETNDNEFTTKSFVYEYLKKVGNGGLDETSKRRIVFNTKKPLPSVLRRQAIENKEEDIYMSPLETCMDDIDKYTEKLQKSMVMPIGEELTKSLEKLLINENGPLKVVELFLVKEPDRYPPEQIMELWELIQNMIKTIKESLPLYLRTFSNTQQHRKFENAFNLLANSIFLKLSFPVSSLILLLPSPLYDDGIKSSSHSPQSIPFPLGFP